VERLEYDPNRTAFIALIKYEDGTQAYILAPQRLAVGDSVVSGQKVDVKPGNAMPLSAMPIGTIVHNVEMKPGKGGQIARSAGSFVQLVGRDSGYAVLRLNSGETRKVPAECMATVGAVSNPDHMNTVTGKAGRTRYYSAYEEYSEPLRRAIQDSVDELAQTVAVPIPENDGDDNEYDDAATGEQYA
jgi:large subunit ribosomal protein L2